MRCGAPSQHQEVSMLRLRDIMTTDVVTVPPALTIRDAMALFATHHLSGAPVVSGRKVVGVVSLTDFAEFGASEPGVPSSRPRQEDEGAPPPWVEGEDAPGNFFAEMWEDSGADVAERFAEVDSPEWNVLVEHTVSEVRTRTI